jgi:hypothetical protein
MKSFKHYHNKVEEVSEKRTNILDLMKKSKIEKKKDKLHLAIVTTIVISTLAVSGILISQ